MAKRLFGLNIPAAKLRRDFILKGKCPGISIGQYDVIKFLGWETDAGSGMEPIEGALIYINRLISDGHEVLVITSRGEPALKIATKWVRKHGLRISITGVNNGSKAKAAKGLDIFIDDDLHKIEPLIKVPHRFLFSQGYNEHVDPYPIARRISSWEELYRTICTLF